MQPVTSNYVKVDVHGNRRKSLDREDGYRWFDMDLISATSISKWDRTTDVVGCCIPSHGLLNWGKGVSYKGLDDGYVSISC